MSEAQARRWIVALTHSEGRLEGLESELQAQDFEVLRVPLIQTRTLAGVSLEPLQDCSWWLFTSGAAVRAVLELGGTLARHQLGAVGESTAEAIRSAGAEVALVSSAPEARSLAQSFLSRHEPGPVGVPQGNLAAPTLVNLLLEGGLEVRALTVYTTVSRPWPPTLPQPDLVVLASPSAVEALPLAVASEAQLIALGPTTAKRLRELGLSYVTAPAASVKGVLKAAEQLRSELCC